MTEPIVDRLLGSEEPSIRWKTRVQVLGESRASGRIRALEREVRSSPRVRELLSQRDETGRLRPSNPYAKWNGAHWVLATLADIGHPRADRTLLPVRDQLLDFWLRPRYFTDLPIEKRSQLYKEEGVPVIQGRHRRCASQHGNALFSILTLGIANARTEELVERLLTWQWPDGGWNCDRNPAASHSSFMESILPLRALALVARESRDRKAGRAARRAAEIFLKRRLFRRERNGEVMRKGFLELHYPLYWHYDVLHGLKVMNEAGWLDDPRCGEALDWLESKRLPDGGWPAEKRFHRGKQASTGPGDLVDWGVGGRRRANEWVTVDALAVLQGAGRFQA